MCVRKKRKKGGGGGAKLLPGAPHIIIKKAAAGPGADVQQCRGVILAAEATRWTRGTKKRLDFAPRRLFISGVSAPRTASRRCDEWETVSVI